MEIFGATPARSNICCNAGLVAQRLARYLQATIKRAPAHALTASYMRGPTFRAGLAGMWAIRFALIIFGSLVGYLLAGSRPAGSLLLRPPRGPGGMGDTNLSWLSLGQPPSPPKHTTNKTRNEQTLWDPLRFTSSRKLSLAKSPTKLQGSKPYSKRAQRPKDPGPEFLTFLWFVF